jgi:hypothetical protein
VASLPIAAFPPTVKSPVAINLVAVISEPAEVALKAMV